VPCTQPAANHSADPLDLVLIGDSIVERWNGTAALGSAARPEFRKVADKYFNERSGGNSSSRSINAVLLGAAGDTTHSLLWRITKGNMLPESLHPKAFMVVIGTNNLISCCLKKETFDAIVNVVTEVHDRFPQSTIIVHGLLPRFQNKWYPKLAFSYEIILWINCQLRRFCEDRRNSAGWSILYMENMDIFLAPEVVDGTSTLTLNLTTINANDGIPPTVAGYDAWGPRIVDFVQNIPSP